MREIPTPNGIARINRGAGIDNYAALYDARVAMDNELDLRVDFTSLQRLQGAFGLPISSIEVVRYATTPVTITGWEIVNGSPTLAWSVG